jgi:hypothetical protein
MRAPLRRSCGGRWGSVGRRTWAGLCFGGRLRPTDQAGQTAARGTRGSATALGQRSWLTRCCRTVWSGHLAWSRDYAAWSLWSLMSEWTGLEGPNELGGQDGARPQRGPAR